MATETTRHFAPPTPSTPRHSCHFHKHEPAVDNCARCGKPICKDCSESYRVVNDEFEGKPLCYECCAELVKDNVRLLKRNKRKILFNFIFTIIGMLFGLFVGTRFTTGADAGDIPGGYKAFIIIISIFIGGCLWTFIKGWARRMFGKKGDEFSWIRFFVGLIIGFFIEAILSIFRTIAKIVNHIRYLVRTSKLIKSDAQAVKEITDYFNYTMVMDQNAGADLSTLVGENGALRNNSFARTVLENGEIAAAENVRNCVTSISESGEIIRSFQD